MIVLGLLLMVMYVPGLTGHYMPPGWAFLSIALPWFLWGRDAATLSLPHILLLAFFAYALASLTWTYTFYDGVLELWQFLIIGMAFYIGSFRNLKRFFQGASIGLAVNSLVSILQWYQIHPVEHLTNSYSSGLMYNPVILAEASALALVGAWVYQIWWGIPLILPSFLLAQSRGAIIALLVATVCNATRNWLVFGVLAAVLSIFTWLTFRYGDNIRIVVWNQAITNLLPLGNGAGSFQDVFITDGTKLFHAEYAHNEYLQLIFEFGVGALLLAVVMGMLVLNPSAPEWPIFICFLTMAVYSWPIHAPIPACVGALVAGRLATVWDVVWRERMARRHGFLVWAG